MALIWNGPHTSAVIPETSVEEDVDLHSTEQSPSGEHEGSNQTEPMVDIRGGEGRMEKGGSRTSGAGERSRQDRNRMSHYPFHNLIRVDSVTILFSNGLVVVG